MPPKVKYTRDYILSVALDITREKGIEAVTARELGARLGASSRPIFTAFENMEEVHNEIIKAAKKIFYQYTGDYMNYTPAFKRFGTQMVRFSIDEPKLYRLLFMRETPGETDIMGAVMELYDNPDDILEILMKDYGINQEHAWKLFNHMTIFTYGITVLCARKICVFNEAEIDQLLGEEFAGILGLIKSGRYRHFGIKPEFGDGSAQGINTANIPIPEADYI